MGSLGILAAKEHFLTLMKQVDSSMLPQFAIWLDYKVSEYKILGSIKYGSQYNSKSEDRYPAWITKALRQNLTFLFSDMDSTKEMTNSDVPLSNDKTEDDAPRRRKRPRLHEASLNSQYISHTSAPSDFDPDRTRMIPCTSVYPDADGLDRQAEITNDVTEDTPFTVKQEVVEIEENDDPDIESFSCLRENIPKEPSIDEGMIEEHNSSTDVLAPRAPAIDQNLRNATDRTDSLLSQVMRNIKNISSVEVEEQPTLVTASSNLYEPINERRASQLSRNMVHVEEQPTLVTASSTSYESINEMRSSQLPRSMNHPLFPQTAEGSSPSVDVTVENPDVCCPHCRILLRANDLSMHISLQHPELKIAPFAYDVVAANRTAVQLPPTLRRAPMPTLGPRASCSGDTSKRPAYPNRLFKTGHRTQFLGPRHIHSMKAESNAQRRNVSNEYSESSYGDLDGTDNKSTVRYKKFREKIKSDPELLNKYREQNRIHQRMSRLRRKMKQQANT